MIRAMEALETLFCRSDRISPSLPSSFDLLRAPLGLPSRLPRAFAAAKPSFVRSAMRSRSISAKSPKSAIMALVWRFCFPSNKVDCLFDRHEAHFLLDEAINDLQNLTKATAKTRQLTDDDSITWL